MPLKLERRGQFVNALVEHFHHAVVAAIDCDFADPDRAPRFNLRSRIGCKDSGPAHPSKTFPHAFDNARLIVAPLILIIVSNKIGDSLPVSVLDGVKEIFRMYLDLTLRPPQPEQVKPDAKRQGQPAIECPAI